MKCSNCQKEVSDNYWRIDKETDQYTTSKDTNKVVFSCADCRELLLQLYSGGSSVVNAPEWLNQKFPTKESREKAKQLSLYKSGNRINDTNDPDRGIYKLHCVNLAGELDLSDFRNLEFFVLHEQDSLVKLKGLEHLTKLVYFYIDKCSRLQPPYTFLEAWKQEITQLKAQLAEYESPETTSDPSEPLNTKIQRKKAQLSQAITSGRRSTAPLRKEIELLEKIQTLETQVSTLQIKETNYQEQIRQKEQAINAKQSQITNLQSQLTAKTTAEKQAQQKITQLERQITNLQAEKAAIQEKMLQERQEALAQWEQEKATLQTQITQLAEQKDTFQKSADYLLSTLKDTEKTLTDTQSTLAQTQENARKAQETHQQTQSQKDQELAKKQEAYALIQERNTDLQAKLALTQEEVSKLTQWISKLEAASAEGDTLQTLQKELAQAQGQVTTLEEELSVKSPKRNYLWVYAILALIALYFLLS